MKLAGFVVLALSLVAVASAKEFPGDLMVCGATRCRVLTATDSRAFSALLWGDRPVTRAPTPRVGASVYQLRTKSGPIGAIITATAIRVHGLNCGRFERGHWYRLPRALQGLTAGLEPKRLRPPVPRSC